MATHEHSINVALAEVLRGTRHAWTIGADIVSAEPTSALHGSARRPDVLVVEPDTSPVVVETEIAPAHTLEADALSRLGERLRSNGQQILSAVAVRIPKEIASLEGSALREALKASALECAMFSGVTSAQAERFPKTGWVQAPLTDLSALVQAASVPTSVIDAAANALIDGVQQAAGVLKQMGAAHPGALLQAANTLHQADGEQTRRMVATIITDAMLFQEVLAGSHGELAEVLNLDQIVGRDGHLTRANILVEWRKILSVNYWPIFDIARRLLESLPMAGTTELLSNLHNTVSLLLSKRVMRSHDLTGAVFQRLIADRKFLAAYYTTPAAAALLAGLAISESETPNGGAWEDAGAVEDVRVGDFACGTGTLLSTAYRRIGQLHESAGGNMTARHPKMMAASIAGCDVLPTAAHLTASMLSGLHPSAEYTNSSIYNVAFGLQPDGGVALGALDLLDPQGNLKIASATAKSLGGKGAKELAVQETFKPNEFDLVIMNPPFTRDTNHEGKKKSIANPAFAAFGTDTLTQKKMSKRLAKIASGSAYHGNAGEASAFVALAHKQLRTGGRLAFVLPLSVLGGEGWKNVRRLLTSNYSNICVGSIAAAKAKDAAFSADTDIAECVLTARKGGSSNRAHFFVLAKRPANQLEGAYIAREIRRLADSPSGRSLESGPIGGDPIRVGGDKIGELLSAPLQGEAPWHLNRIADLSLAQAAYQLTERQKLWLPGMPAPMSTEFPFCRLGLYAQTGPIDRDIKEATENKAGVPRGPFEIEDIPPGGSPTYPALWAHDAKAETRIIVAADKQATIRYSPDPEVQSAIHERAAQVWSTASRVHINRDFQFNSQPLAACYTTDRTIGGRAWPSVIFDDERLEKAFVLWCNTSLGILCHWWQSSKIQQGRGSITPSAIPALKVYDVRALNEGRLDAASEIFDHYATVELRPANEAAWDGARVALDNDALGRVFGVEPALLQSGGVVDKLRQKLSAEPSINGGKKSTNRRAVITTLAS